MSDSHAPEFSLVKKLSDIGKAKPETVKANPDQLKALAKRFDLPSIGALEASFTLESASDRVNFKGTLQSKVVQSCAISGQELPAQIDEEFDIAFVEASAIAASEDEVELSSDDCDVMEYQGNQIDIGEALAQTLFLALDPYPRAPDAEEVARKNGLQSEEEAGPFGALAALKDKLG